MTSLRDRTRRGIGTGVSIPFKVEVEPTQGRFGKQVNEALSTLWPLVLRSHNLFRLRGLLQQVGDVCWHIDTARAGLARKLSLDLRTNVNCDRHR
jgi:hypothetical protein